MDIKIKASKGTLVAEDAPTTSWKELKPHWQSIAKAVIEIFLEGKFNHILLAKKEKTDSMPTSGIGKNH